MSTVNFNVTRGYTSIAGPGSTAAIVTVNRACQYQFSTLMPNASSGGHHIDFNQSVELNSMGSGVYMWVKSEFDNSVAILTLNSDAVIAITKNQ